MDLSGSIVHLFSPVFLVLSTLILLSTGCGGERPGPGHLAQLISPADGWRAESPGVAYSYENLHEYVNGGAERYLGYGFRELYLADFINEQHTGALRVEVYLMDSPANAYGIFSSDRGGEDPGDIGSDAALGSYLLQFWQGPCFIRIQDMELTGRLGGAMAEFGRLISEAIPYPAGQGCPELVAVIPEQGLLKESVCYFHTQNSLNSFIYLGKSNLLRLSEQTDAVTAEYVIDSDGAQISRLFLISYQDSSAARSILGGLKDSPEAVSAGLVHAAELKNNLLLIFGETATEWARKIERAISKAL